MTVRILTDSAADLPQEIVRERGIAVLPFAVNDGERDYLDGESIDSVYVLNEMRGGKVFKTSQVPIGRFEQIFAEVAEKGESAIYIGFSSALSGTFQASILARSESLERYPELDLEVIDTRCASLGCGLVALHAAELSAQGRSKEEIAEASKRMAGQMEHLFTVDDLEYLYRGGRVGRSAALIGGLLNIKPLMHVADGKLVPLEKIRGRKKVLQRMLELMEQRGTRLEEQTIGIVHGDDPEAASQLKEMIEHRFGCRRFVINTLGSTIGAHAGPGTLAVFFLGGNRSV